MASISKWLGCNKPPIQEQKKITQWDYLDQDNQLIASKYRYDTASGKRYLPSLHLRSGLCITFQASLNLIE